jgi:peptidoglycan/xylan/chitin deacetylase (PgdA/CDA1 family)
VAVQFALNYEEGSEYSVADGDGRTELGLAEAPGGRVPAGRRDLAFETMYEFGSRVGVWRLFRLFAERSVPLTVFGCAVALERNPRVAEAIARSGYDVCCHGWRWEEQFGLDEDDERDRIAWAIESIKRMTGERPLGWYCRYGPSENTRRLLVEEGGFLYDSDAYNDELPYWVEVGGKAHLVVPYTMDANDGKFGASRRVRLPIGFRVLSQSDLRPTLRRRRRLARSYVGRPPSTSRWPSGPRPSAGLGAGPYLEARSRLDLPAD